MDKRELVERLLATFVVELDDHVAALEAELLAAEHGASPEQIAAMFRTAHTIKGAARAVGLTPIEAAASAIEDWLADARDGTRMLGSADVTLLLAAVDAFRAARAALADGRPVEPIFAPLMPRLAALAGPPGAAGPDPAVDPAIDPVAATAGPVGDRGDPAALDQLARLVGELVDRTGDDAGDDQVLRDLADAWRRGRGDPAATVRTLDQLAWRRRIARGAIARAAQQVEDALDDVRLVAFGEVVAGLARTVRDLATTLGKPLELVVEEGDIQVERAVARGLRDPILHLVRNAADHGIEPADARRAAGKPAVGRITVSGHLVGDLAEVVVRDDGRGLDRVVLARVLADRGQPVALDDDDALADAAFLPGVSTATAVTDLSGRGVGLDAVRARVESLRGTVGLEFAAGQGTAVTIRVPRSVARLRVAIMTVGDITVAIPVSVIERIVRAERGALIVYDGRESVVIGDAPIPVVALALAIGGDAPVLGDRFTVVVVGTGRRRAGVVVDGVIAEREVAVHSLGARTRGLRHVLGAVAIDGRAVVVIEPGELVRRALAGSPQPLAAATPTSAIRRSILLADDSMTTRNLERIILEGAGYEVIAAVDGSEAWQVLQERPIDLVVSDVEMPGLDGFELCERIRASPKLAELPVVLVTALASDRDRARGLAAGADAYVVKKPFDQHGLLDVIAQLLP